MVAHGLGDARRHGARFGGVVPRRSMMSASPRPVKPRPTRRLAIASLRCCSSGQAVTSSTLSSMRTATATTLPKRSKSKKPARKFVSYELGEIDRSEAAAAVGRQRLLGAGVGRLDRLAVIEVVVLVHAIEEHHARLGVVVGRAHDLVPELARAHGAVDPHRLRAGALPRSSARASPCARGRRRGPFPPPP